MSENNSLERVEPLVSVIIPAYNAEKSIGKTIMSVLNQTYRSLEVIVVDDGSSDRTAAIVKSYAQTDKRVIFLQQNNSGVAAARNLAIAKSKGEFIAAIDADDSWYPQNIAKQVECFLRSDSNVGLVYSWSVDIDEDYALLGGFRAAEIEGEVYNTLICHNFIGNASASMIRRGCWGANEPYNCQMKLQDAQGCEDWELYLRIAEQYQFKVVPEFLIGYRKLFDSMSGDYQQMARSHELILDAVRDKHPYLPNIIYRLSRSNLYMYFAHQSNRCGKHSKTRYWIYRALKADLITPFIRLGLYRLSIASTLGSIGKFFWKSTSNRPQQDQQKLSSTSPLTIADIEKRELTIKLMIGVGNLFDRAISTIAGKSPKNLTLNPIELPEIKGEKGY